MSIATHTRATNSVLRALSPEENQRLLAHSEQVDLTYGDILCEPGKQIRHVYFPNNGIISLLTPLDGHDSAEVGLVGREGMAGMALFLGISVSPVRMLGQGTGTATRMKAVSFRKELKRNPVLQLELSHYLYAFMAQVAQTAASNRHHQLGERLARWLLMTHDRVQSNEYHLTKNFSRTCSEYGESELPGRQDCCKKKSLSVIAAAILPFSIARVWSAPRAAAIGMSTISVTAC
jgi:CRP-like cAMP-binding protein